jgi:hypothetical protein
MDSRRVGLGLGLLSCVWACSREAPPLASADAPPVRPAPSAASAAAEVPSSAPSGSAPKPGDVDFRPVQELDCDEAYLHVLPTKTFLSCNQRLLVIEGDAVREEPSYQRGIPPEEPVFLWQITSVAGWWPDAAWLGRNRSTEYAAQGELFRWKGQQWAKVADARRDEPLSDLLPWTDERVVALVQPPHTFGARFIPLGSSPFAVPSFTAPKVPHERCRSRLRAQVQTAVAPGELLVAGGQVCDVTRVHGQWEPVYSGLGVERFTAGQPRGQLMLLELPPEAPPDAVRDATALVAVGPNRALLAAHAVLDGGRTLGVLARWDGARFHAEPAPFAEGIGRLWVGGPDRLWATDRTGHLWRAEAGRWERVPWEPPEPEATEITTVWVRSPGDVWLIARQMRENRSVVYHARRG